jgi:hypothetical protein
MSADPVNKNSNISKEARLWAALQRIHARTHHHRLGDDPEARRALREWETAFLAKDANRPADVVIPFDRRHK